MIDINKMFRMICIELKIGLNNNHKDALNDDNILDYMNNKMYN